jgi:ABC-type nitrate/sulfonate/bicarbonate transport system substrate-binding protein
MTKTIARLLSALSCLFCIGAACAEDVTVSYPSFNAFYMDHLVAIDKGYMREEGLNVEVVKAGGGTATQTLLAGQLHFSSSAGSALSAGVRGGAVKIVYTNLSRVAYRLVSNKPELRTLQDLLGKKIAINTFGDTGHLATLLLLKQRGIDPKAVLFVAVRSEARFPAFVSGSVDAAPLMPRDIDQMGRLKGHVVADLAKEVQLVWNGVAVADKFLVENPLLVERFLHAIARGREFARRYKEPTIAIVAKYNPAPADALVRDYDAALASMTPEGSVPEEVLKAEVATRAEMTKVANPPDAATLYDYSSIKKIYAELKRAGNQSPKAGLSP